MKKLIEFPSDNNQIILVEVEDPDAIQGEDRVARPGDLIAEVASDTFESALKKVKPAITSVMTVLREINEPEEIEVSFGIKLSAKAGAFIASADAEANFTVKVTWKNT